MIHSRLPRRARTHWPPREDRPDEPMDWPRLTLLVLTVTAAVMGLVILAIGLAK